jgi:ribonuclease J
MGNIQIQIHRGSNEIGGNCIEITADSTNILLDIGLPLSGEYEISSEKFNHIDAVFISHAHQDHYGLLNHIDNSIPVYTGELTRQLMDASRIFNGKKPFSSEFRYILNQQPVEVGSFIITPYLVDHSSPDSYAFLIEACGKRIFYTGDFRAHGRKAALYNRMVDNPPAEIDALIIEGTMLGREDAEVRTETQVEKAMYDVMVKEPGPCFLLSSSQNIDRLVSAYRAALHARRLFVVDIYTAWILDRMSQHSEHTPTIEWDRIKVLSKGRTASNHYGRLKDNPDVFGSFVRRLYDWNNVITESTLAEHPEKYLIKNARIEWLITSMECAHTSVIFSMWEGYLKEEYNPEGFRRYEKLMQDEHVNFVKIHTSGHAIPEDLKTFIQALRPVKVIPIHTEEPDQYQYLLNDVPVSIIYDRSISL